MSKPRRTPATAPEVVREPENQNPEAPKMAIGAMTVDRWEMVTKSARNQALITSFAVSERLAHGATRKLTPDEWRGAFDAWCAQPRI